MGRQLKQDKFLPQPQPQPGQLSLAALPESPVGPDQGDPDIALDPVRRRRPVVPHRWLSRN